MNSINYPKKEEKALKLAKKRFALISWVENEMKFSIRIMQTFSPVFKGVDYPRWQVNEYLRYAQRKAVLEDMLSYLNSPNQNIETFNNVEYTLCKLYEIKYLEELETYA